MLAVIKTGGKQYIVSPKKKIKIEKLDIEEGKEVIFEDVLLVNDGEKTIVGKPLIKGATVVGEVLKQDRHKKVVIFKFKPKKRYKVKKGHRQPFTEVQIKEIKVS
ncbi:MAG: 50S ribosomal protein L21 [Candidatus Pacebacteria bacterium]|nr:50S ribosomal protein L21 [Candidatus Paceibacterota bacterium]MDD2796524.1 50S ribosomal protein L21 [Candidatus Paceibacterota bacterium]MDD3047941.1 50S ribosomal protein L21 [Candidatus Paceibacterota bacterium]MDD3510096.1 50S ribosomal protein L21 [Candidatus Paceibacterota bacterium]MDD3918485.1 50S ribosomal protein L21 [Candidatus Paceibacterota bacterium]